MSLIALRLLPAPSDVPGQVLNELALVCLPSGLPCRMCRLASPDLLAQSEGSPSRPLQTTLVPPKSPSDPLAVHQAMLSDWGPRPLRLQRQLG